MTNNSRRLFNETAAKRAEVLPSITNERELTEAIAAVGRSRDPLAARQHVVTAAVAIGKADQLPQGWREACECGDFSDGPTVGDLHVDQPLKTAKKPQGRNPHFTAKLIAMMCEKFTADELTAMVNQARAHAGGMTAAENKKLKAALGDDYVAAEADGETEPDADDAVADAKATEVKAAEITHGDIADLCADGHAFRLFVEYQFAEPPQWMPLLPVPGKYQHPEYGEIKITTQRNANFVSNFASGVYQSSLPVNTEHAPDSGGAYGWIEQLRQNDDGSVDAKVAWTDRGNEAIEKDRFRFISPEWADVWTDPAGKTHSDVLRGAALTVRPYFKDKFLRPLIAREGELFAPTTPRADDTIVFFSAIPPTTVPADRLVDSNNGEKTMPDNTATTKAAEPTTDNSSEFAEMQTKVKSLIEANEAQGVQIKALTEANEKLVTASRTARFNDEVKGKTDGGVKWFGDHAKHVEFLNTLTKAFGEDSDQVKQYIETQRTVARSMAESDLYREIGADGENVSGARNATEKIDTLVAAKMSESKLPYADALAAVIAANPNLYREHTDANTVRV